MRVCTNCKVKFNSGRCPKCRSPQYVREVSYSTGSSTSYDTYVPIPDLASWGYTTGDSDSGSSSNYDSSSSSGYDSGSCDSGSSDSGCSSD